MSSSSAAVPSQEVVVGGVDIKGWSIRTAKSPMLTSQETSEWEDKLGLPELPEMVFGGARVQLVHHATGWMLSFNAFDALDAVDASAEPAKVAASATWLQTASLEKAKDAVREFDWTYATVYGGSTGLCSGGRAPELQTVGPDGAATPTAVDDTDASVVTMGGEDSCMEPVARPIPPAKDIDVELLKQREPILFFDEVVFFEDELADHGSSTFVVKLRVMPSAFFVLARQFIRVDGVLCTVNDTRVFHAFGSDYVVRRQSSKTATCEEMEAVNPSITPAFYAQVEDVIPLLQVVDETTQVFRVTS